MASVFVSYAREDSAKAKSIAHELEQARFDVWMDERIHSGSEFSREIEAALSGASAILVLWSKASIESAWVRDEAAEGRDSGRLVAVTLDSTRPPIGFRQYQATDLSGWSGRGKPKLFDKVIAALQAKTGSEPTKTPATAGRAPSWPPSRAAIAIALALIAAAAVALYLFARPSGGERTALTVTLQPFTASADARDLASEVRNAVSHTLSLGAFSVTNQDGAVAGESPTADFSLSGHVSRSGEKLLATVQMVENTHRVVVFSHQFESSADKAADFAEMVGAQVASQLSWTAPLLQMERRHPSDPSIVGALLQSSAAGIDSTSALHDFETSRRLASAAPKSPLAQNNFAFSSAFALGELPQAQRPATLVAARKAADRAVELAPEFGDNYALWCVLRSELRRAECEDRLRKAMKIDPDAPFVAFFLTYRVLAQVGRNAEAVQLAGQSLAHDQYMPYKIGLALRTLEAVGRSDEADELYKTAVRWWPDNPVIGWFRTVGILTRGDFAALRRFGGPPPVQEMAPVLTAAASRSPAAIRMHCDGDVKDLAEIVCMLALADIGDMDAAFTLADRIYPARRGRNPAEDERIWLDDPNPPPTMFLTGPAARALRTDPRFVPLAGRLGLLDYWRSGRLPDFCKSKPEPVCKQLAGRG